MKAIFRPLIIALLAVPLAVLANDDPAAASDPVLQQARDALAGRRAKSLDPVLLRASTEGLFASRAKDGTSTIRDAVLSNL